MNNANVVTFRVLTKKYRVISRQDGTLQVYEYTKISIYFLCE